MIFSPVNPDRTADAIIDQIEKLILKGVLRSRDRLPAERDLAEQLDVSRPILRNAIKVLEERQLVVSQHGGGTFIADIIGTVFSQSIIDLIKRHPSAIEDYLEYRREIESTTTALAAERATASDKAILADIMQRMEDASQKMDVSEETAIDVDFHTAIGEAAHNIVLLHTLRGCYHLLAEGVFYSRTQLYNYPGARVNILRQHQAIYNSVLSGDV
ncbi:MAG: FadR/GntR family transcriptional regulator, partial [Stappiaceae bacterium]